MAKPQTDFQPENIKDITWTGTLTEDIILGEGRGGMLEIFGGSSAKIIVESVNNSGTDQIVEYDSILPDFYQSSRLHKIKAGSTAPAKITVNY